MSEWFQAKVSSLQQQSNGLIAKVVETYLLDAMSFTEAEARAIKESQGSREVQAVAISRSPIKEVVFYGDTDQWHKVKVCYSLMDEATEKEKKVTTYFLVNANDVKEAYERTEEHLKEMLVPFQIPKVEESPICEVFQYEKQAPKGYVKVEKSNTTYHGEEIESEEECAMDDDSIEAIDEDEERADTDLESRLDAAMKGGCDAG